MFKGGLHCLRGCFRKQAGQGDVLTPLKCFCALLNVFTSKYHNTMDLQMETQLNMKLQMNYFQKNN